MLLDQGFIPSHFHKQESPTQPFGKVKRLQSIHLNVDTLHRSPSVTSSLTSVRPDPFGTMDIKL